MSVQDALLKSLMTKVNATLESSLRNPGSAHREALMHILLKRAKTIAETARGNTGTNAHS